MRTTGIFHSLRHILKSNRGTRYLFTLFFLVILSIFSFVAYHAVVFNRQETVHSWEEKLSAMVDLRYQAIKYWIDGNKFQLFLMSMRPGIDQNLGASAKNKIQDLVGIYLFSKNTSIIQDSASGSAALNANCRQLAADYNESTSNSVDFCTNFNDKLLVVFLLNEKITANSNTFALYVDPQRWLFPFIGRESITTTTLETLLVRRLGSSIQYLAPLRHNKNRPLTFILPPPQKNLPARFALEEKNIQGEFIDYRDKKVLAATRFIEDSKWGLVVKIDGDEALSAYRTRTFAILFGLVGLLFLFAGVLYGLWFKQREFFHLEVLKREAPYRMMMKQANDAIFFLNIRGQIKEANYLAEQIYGYSHQELISLNIENLILNNGDLQNSDQPQLFLQSLKEKPTLEMQHRRKDGSIFSVRVSASSVLINGDELIVYIVHNIEDLKNYQQLLETQAQELRRSNLELEQFSSIASHDLQEPLRTIRGYLELISIDYRDHLDKKAQTFIDYSIACSEKMANIINSLLTYAKVGSKPQPFTRVNLSLLLQEAINNLHSTLRERNAKVVYNDQNMPEINCDYNQMIQLFLNLISNAIKYNKNEEPIVTISSKNMDGMIIVYVQDNGIGIEPRYQEKIFLPFYRLHRDNQYRGNGIGLAICKKIITHHGGNIWVRPTSAGEGTTIGFSIPFSTPKDKSVLAKANCLL